MQALTRGLIVPEGCYRWEGELTPNALIFIVKVCEWSLEVLNVTL